MLEVSVFYIYGGKWNKKYEFYYSLRWKPVYVVHFIFPRESDFHEGLVMY